MLKDTVSHVKQKGKLAVRLPDIHVHGRRTKIKGHNFSRNLRQNTPRSWCTPCEFRCTEWYLAKTNQVFTLRNREMWFHCSNACYDVLQLIVNLINVTKERGVEACCRLIMYSCYEGSKFRAWYKRGAKSSPSSQYIAKESLFSRIFFSQSSENRCRVERKG